MCSAQNASGPPLGEGPAGLPTSPDPPGSWCFPALPGSCFPPHPPPRRLLPTRLGRTIQPGIPGLPWCGVARILLQYRVTFPSQRATLPLLLEAETRASLNLHMDWAMRTVDSSAPRIPLDALPAPCEVTTQPWAFAATGQDGLQPLRAWNLACYPDLLPGT